MYGVFFCCCPGGTNQFDNILLIWAVSAPFSHSSCVWGPFIQRLRLTARAMLGAEAWVDWTWWWGGVSRGKGWVGVCRVDLRLCKGLWVGLCRQRFIWKSVRAACLNRGGWEVGLGRSRMHPTVLLCALTSVCVCACVWEGGGCSGVSICEIMCSYSPVECKKKRGGVCPRPPCFLFSLSAVLQRRSVCVSSLQDWAHHGAIQMKQKPTSFACLENDSLYFVWSRQIHLVWQEGNKGSLTFEVISQKHHLYQHASSSVLSILFHQQVL